MTGRAAYALFMLLAAVTFLTVRHFVPRPPAYQRLPWSDRILLMLAAFTGGVLGAKIPFVLGVMSGPDPGFLGWRLWFADGKTITAGLAGAYLGVELGKLALGIRIKTGDTFALPLACALAVGRLGCFFNGCCYGVSTEVPWGVDFVYLDGLTHRCHPTQVYESLFHLGMAGLLLLMIRLDVLKNQRLKCYLIAYCVYRFLSEFIRPEQAFFLGLTFYQCFCVAAAVALAVQWWVDSRPETARPGPSLSPVAGYQGSGRAGR
jgi:phosphatidylglycerol:prolipoprotein diacylglycerol transferase